MTLSFHFFFVLESSGVDTSKFISVEAESVDAESVGVLFESSVEVVVESVTVSDEIEASVVEEDV